MEGKMATLSIFNHSIVSGNNAVNFEVWVTDGLLQFVVDGVIRHDISSVTEFLTEAAKQINKPNSTDDIIVEKSGSISDNAVENFENGSVTLDTGGTNPSITLQDDMTAVNIGGSGVGGSFRVDFGTGLNAQAEAATFLEFADDLLGKTEINELEVVSGVQIGDFSRSVTISERVDDIRQIKFKSSNDVRDKSWADIVIDDLGEVDGGTRTSNGNVSESSFSASQMNVDGLEVNLGSQGVGGKEVWVFDTEDEAQDFANAVLESFGAGSDRRATLNEAIELIAEDLGGTQTHNGNVSTSYRASQIKLIGEDNEIVDLGSHGVGGRERYAFENRETAQQFIDEVRDAVGVEAREGKLVDEFVFKVSGGAGINGSPTFVGQDDFIEFIGAEFDGVRVRDGAVSESFDGSSKIVGDGTDVQLGPRGVGGKEVWDFDTAEDAQAFRTTLDDIFG